MKERGGKGGGEGRIGVLQTYDMAVHQPCPWIVAREGDNHPPRVRQERHVPPRRILKRQVRDTRIRKVTGALAQHVEIVAVQVDRMRHGRCLRYLLDDPIIPVHASFELDQVFTFGVVGIFLLDVGEDRLFPIYVDGSEVDTPDDDVLLVTSGTCVLRDVDVQILRLRGESGRGDIVGNVGDERRVFFAVLGFGSPSAGGIDCRGASVAEDGRGTVHVVIGALATCFGDGAEPPVGVVILVSFDDYVVALADPEEEPVRGSGLYGY